MKRQSAKYPVPTDLKTDQFTPPMRGNLFALARGGSSSSAADQIEKCNSQDQAKVVRDGVIAESAGLKLKAGGFIVEDIFFKVKSQATLVKGERIRRINAENSPFFLAIASMYAVQRGVKQAELAICTPHLVRKCAYRISATTAQGGFAGPINPQRLLSPG